MAIAKKLVASLLISLLVLQMVEADDQMIVEALAMPGASYHPGHGSVRGHAGLVVPVAAVFHRELPVTMMPAPATPA
ncbi:hypothetical protein Tsubulata_051227 [Turnera subulata]|uniref:Uncharacterized protein n=1 Tax=Turnera subulata TaxID=218843 RepID=A0A9Q0GGT6_9ROSI|nr:hypothetical protein Tsubulata_051227 [Turnera subulata]